ncbi:MAG: DegV family protein [Dehalococcoidia bacterium]
MIKIICDSTADIPADIISKFGISIVPINVIFGTETYRDGIDITAEQFYKRLVESKIHPTTSAQSPGYFSELFTRLSKETKEILVILFSSKISATYESAIQAKALVGDFFILGFRVYASLFWFIGVAIVLGYLLAQTRTGNWIQASGGNAGAARARGVNVARTKTGLFVLTAMVSAFAGIISSIRTSAANPNSGTGYELEIIAMVVIGGTALTGGRGTVIGTVIGVLILRVMRNGIVMVGVPGLAYNIFIGAIILAMVGLHASLERRRRAEA